MLAKIFEDFVYLALLAILIAAFAAIVVHGLSKQDGKTVNQSAIEERAVSK